MLKEGNIRLSGLFYKLGQKIGKGLIKGKTYYKYLLGDDRESIGAESLIGSKIAGQIIKENAISKNREHNRQINRLGQVLASHLKNKYYKFRFFIIKSKDVNAFAVPGGFIFITSSLFKEVKSRPDELAFVFAHEIMHIILKHPIKKILSDYSSRAVGKILNKGGSLGILMNQIITSLFKNTYSRDKEFEADSKAIKLMQACNYEPSKAISLLGKLKKRPVEVPAYNYFSSHPDIDDRIKNINGLLSE